MESKQEKLAISISIAIVGLCTLIYFIALAIEHHKKELFYDDFDAAREECRDNITTLQIYDMKEGDHVTAFNVSVVFDDRNLSSTWFHTNRYVAAVSLDADFESLSMSERCWICNRIMEEAKQRLREYHKNTRYYALLESHKAYDHAVMYRGKTLLLYEEYEFDFYGTNYTYTFPGYGSMTVTVKGTSINDFYDFRYKDGKLTKFASKYGSGNSGSGNTANSAKPSSSSSTKYNYDPYNVQGYKSAQDFADDKYEEFYDYEDDYEDEDEAYDAAEDYWNDHH